MKSAVNSPSNQVRILRRVAQHGHGWVFTPADFADLGDPRAVGMALTRLVRDGQLRRIGRGLYDRPRPHPILGLGVASTQAVVDAVARKKKIRVLPSKAVAANELGLSTQVPAQLVYHTDGAPFSLHLGQLKIVFRRSAGRLMSLSGRTTGVVAQALRELGRDRVTPQHLRLLHDRIPPAARRQLLQDLDAVPAWMRPHLRELAR